MARTMHMPTHAELPKGPRREFVEELRRYYRAAGRPPLRKISRAIEGRAELKEVTASQETVRRMLRGRTLPTDWDRVFAVFFVLCEMGNINPEDERWEDSYNGSESNADYLKRLWDTALEEDPNPLPIPQPAGRGPVEDPWAPAPSGFGRDEPPF
jgi:hypothetical protein